MLDYRPAGRGPFAVKLADIQSTDKVLNVGCYNGHLERFFLEGKCQDFRGIDANREAIDFAKSQPHGDCFQFGVAEALPFESQSFDKVLCLDTLEHVQDEAKAIDEIHRVLKPGGSVILSVPHDFMNALDPDELTRGLRNFSRKYFTKKPLLDHPKHRHYSESLLRSMLGTRFEVTHVHKSGTPIFWGLAMFYTAMAIPERWTLPLRSVTNPIEDWEYALSLPTGFNIMIKARKK